LKEAKKGLVLCQYHMPFRGNIKRSSLREITEVLLEQCIMLRKRARQEALDHVGRRACLTEKTRLRK